MPKFQLNKLVRDNLVKMSHDAGIKVDYVSLQGEEAILELFNKLGEEFQELKNEQDPDKRIDELGDIQTVINTLYKELWYTKEEFDLVIREKAKEKWWFDQKLYVRTMEMSQDNKRTAYYRKDPKKHPELNE